MRALLLILQTNKQTVNKNLVFNTEAYLEPCETSVMKLLCKNS